MPTKPQIPKILNLKPGENFNFLREEGIKLIQQLAGNQWTDHNRHDPGITLLEAFCYNLTDLSLRSNIDISDLVSSGQPTNHNGLFSPEEILTGGPVTINDFRKLLIDIDGVKNGWLLPIISSQVNGVNGLYDVLLELDEDEELGDLNSSIITREISIDFGAGDVRDYQIEFSFPYWDEEDVAPFRTDVTINSITGPSGQPIVLVETDPDGQNDFFTELEVTYNTTETFSFALTIRVRQSIGNDPVENLAVESEIINLLSEVLGGGPADQSLLKVYNRKVLAAFAVRSTVLEVLTNNRNLSEDFHDIKAVRIQEIALQVQIEVLQDLNIEKYLAEILLQLERFFSPDVPFSSLEDLISKKIPIENILEGPRLNNGFIPDDSLYGFRGNQTDINVRTIYVSDLVKLLIQASLDISTSINSAIEGQPLAIQRFYISNFIRNRIVTANANDCLVLAKPELFKPKFSLNKSQFVFLKNNVEIPYNEELVMSLYQELKATSSAGTSSISPIPFPEGTPLSIADFHSIQHDLPAVYGLGNNVLSLTFSAERRASSEQLRAYLVAVDHLLASYSSQLFHLNELFSISETVDNTYFSRPLYDIPYLERMLLSFLNGTVSWEDFQNDATNSYQSRLNDLFETPEVFIYRRNRFLNHILSRYGVSFADYTTYRNMEETGSATEPNELQVREQEILHDLIFDKVRFLQHYPILSKQRFSSFNYSQTAWDTDNSGTFTKRLLTLLGIQNLERRTLSNEENSFIQTTNVGPNWTFSILDSNSVPILESETDYPSEPDAINAGRLAIMRGVVRNNYLLETQMVGSDLQYLIRLKEDNSEPPSILANGPGLIEEEWEARTRIRAIIRDIKDIGSGFYVVEHILLRPDPNAVSPEELAITENGASQPVTNPYSFRITIIFPSGFIRDFTTDDDPVPDIPAHFANNAFRDYTKKMIREETPAHIIPYIFWLDKNSGASQPNTPSLENFEQRWQNWLEAKADVTTTPLVLANLRNELVTVLNSIFEEIN